MSITRKLRKLKHLTPAEIGWRLRQRQTRRKDRRRYLHAIGPDCAVARQDASIDQHNLSRLIVGARRDQLARFASVAPSFHTQLAERIAGRAGAILSGKWRMLGQDYDLGDPIQWHDDPQTGRQWPRSFYADIALHDRRSGLDVKYVWELGRQQYVVELARHGLLSDAAESAARAHQIIVDFIQENPLYCGVHWASALEVAMRSFSWIWSLATLSGGPVGEASSRAVLESSLVDHADFLFHHLEFYASPYNHLIGEAAALYWLSLAVKHPAARHWKQRSREVLQEHGPRQFHEDGFCVEQATGYHYYTLGFLAMAIVAARGQGDPLSELESVVHRAFRAGLAFRQPNGRWPAIGDVDSARSIPVYHDDFWNFDSLCNLAAAMFDDPQLKIESSGPGEELYWLLGTDGVERWRRLDSSTRSTSTVFLTDSGYVVGGKGGDWFLLDAGPVSAGLFSDSTPSTAHGHADTLQVLYCSDGNPVLRDSGMPFYNGDAEWIRHFRSPAAHNTLAVSGLPFVHDDGALAWSRARPTPSLSADLGDDTWLAHAQASLAPNAVVQRYVLCRPGQGLWVADSVRLDRDRDVHWYWQLPRGVYRLIDSDGGSSIVSDDDGVPVLVIRGNRQDLEIEIETAHVGKPASWDCECYGEKKRAARVIVRLRTTDAVVLTGVCPRMAVVAKLGRQSLGVPACSKVEPEKIAHRGCTWHLYHECRLPAVSGK